MIRKFKYISGVFIVISILILVLEILLPLFSKEEALLALGDSYDASTGWTMRDATGAEKAGVTLPCTIPKDKAGEVTLRHDVISDYKGLALNFYAENAALRILIDGKPIYEAGVSGKRRFIKRFDKLSQESVYVGALTPFSDEEGDLSDGEEIAEKEEAGEIVADLPASLDDGTMVIELTQVNEKDDIYVHPAYISRRDVRIIGNLAESLLPIICCLLLMIMATVLVIMDIIRTVYGGVTRGLYAIALLGIDGIVFIILRTNLMRMFFSNKVFFEEMLTLSFILVPFFLSVYEYKRFYEYFPLTSEGFFWCVGLLTVLNLFVKEMMPQGDIESSLLITRVAYGGTLLFSFVQVVRWAVSMREAEGVGVYLVLDLLSLSFLTGAAVMCMLGKMSRQEWFSNLVIDVQITLSVFFIMLQNIIMVFTEYRQEVELNSRILEKQVRMAEEARADAVVANEAKSVFLANMSHEIRTPINAVLGMDEMILRESREKQIRDYAMDIHTAGLSLLAIINDILDLSKIESGKMEIVPVEYDLSSVIHDLVNMIMLRAKKKNLDFQVCIDGKLPSRLFGDDVRLKQIITNILTNAVKYTEKGTVWMRVSGVQDGEDEILHVEIEDTGIGIKKEDMGKLFEAFQRIEEKRNRNIEGTGLGINITMKLLSLMGSRLNVESEYGRGSKFWFDLRQKIMSLVPLGDFEDRVRQMSEDHVYKKSFIAPEAEILVVDDNSMNRKVFAALLKPTKVKITEADGGQRAIELASSRHFDIIFMDHMMPAIDGVEALHRIRSLTDYPCKDTPIYVLTANAVAGAKEMYLEEGFQGFLSKPVVAEKLEEAIRESLPDHMLLPADEDEEDEAREEDTAFLDDLPIVEGMDWQIAFLHLPGKELLESSLKEFYSLIELHAGKLQKMKEGFPEERDAYRIQVHGMKSAAALLGIIPLSGMAKILEFAARDGDFDRIDALNGIFIEEWLSYKEKLHGVMGLGETDEVEKDEVDTEALMALLNSIKEAMEELDIDAADEGIAKLKALKLPPSVSEEEKELEVRVADLDSDGAVEIIDRIKELIKE